MCQTLLHQVQNQQIRQGPHAGKLLDHFKDETAYEPTSLAVLFVFTDFIHILIYLV